MLKINALVIIYVLIATIIIGLSEAVNQKIKYHVFIINCIILLCEIFPFVYPINSAFFKLFYDWFSLICCPLLFLQTEQLASAYHKDTFDTLLIQFERKYFPYVMNFHNNNRADFKILSEYLHLCYLSFYLFIYGIPLYFYLTHQFMPFYKSVFIILLLLFSCYLTYSIIPVCGPRYLFEKINDHRSHGLIFQTVHKILEKGSAYGTAFPSGHTGIACVVLLITWYLSSSLFYIILPFGIGLIISTVYGRFHYVIDVIFGFLYAIIAFIVTIAIYN